MSDTATQLETERRVVYPSASVPAVPAFVFTGPDGWTVDEAPGAVVVLRAPEHPDGSQVEAILRHDRIAVEVTLEDAANGTWSRIERESTDAKLSFERVARYGPNVAYLRGFSTSAPDGGRIAEMQALFLAPSADGRKTSDLFQLSISGSPAALNEHGQEFVDMVATFRFI